MSPVQTMKPIVKVEIFKTNVKKFKEAQQLLQHLQRKFPCIRFNFDLLDCDNILRAEGESVDVAAIIDVLAMHHYYCDPLPD